ncbi:MAG: hybrid sensor histidine kinase/response regulator transcription factor [Marinifilaceae bacterium]
MKFVILFLFLNILLPGSVAFPIKLQSYLFNHYYNPQCPITDIVTIEEDKRGFIWISSRSYGVFRFDGTNHINISELAGIDSLADIRGSISIDSNNNLWFISQQRIKLYSCDGNNIISTPSSLAEFDKVKQLMHLDNDHIVINNKDSVWSYNIKDDKVNKLAISCDRLIGCTRDEVWYTDRNMFCKYIFKTNECQIVASSGFNTANINVITKLSDGSYLIGLFREGLVLLSSDGFCKPLIGNDIIRDIEANGDGSYWIASESGLYRYYEENGKLEVTRKEWINPYGLPDNAVYAIKKDSKQGLWIGTFFKGLSYIPKRILDYTYINPAISNNLNVGNVIRTLATDNNNNLWIATEDGGLNCLYSQRGEIINYSAHNNTHPLSSTNIHGLIFYNNEIWAGTYKEGIDVLNPQTGKVIRHYNKHDNGLLDNFILDMKQSKDGQLFIGSKGGVQQYNLATDSFTTLIKGIAVYSMAIDSDNCLWIGSTSGLFKQNNKGEIPKRMDMFEQTGKQRCIITFIKEHSDRSIWIGTNKGLYKYVSTDCKFQYIDISTNKLTLEIKAIEEDQYGYVWLSTSNGILRLDTATNKAIHFSFKTEPTTSQFNYNSVYKNLEGDIWFGSLNGLIRFTPKEKYNEVQDREIVISAFSYNRMEGDGYVTHHRNFTNSIFNNNLPHKQNNIKIELFCADYANSANRKFMYNIEGYTRGWITTESNAIELQNLYPGKYNIRVKGYSPIDRFSTLETSFAFTIAPPIYLSLYAYIIYGFLIVVSVSVILYFYHKREKLKRQRMEQQLHARHEIELYESKIDFFTSMAHEIRTPLTLIKAPLENIEELINNDKVNSHISVIKRNTEWLFSLCTQLLDMRHMKNCHRELNINIAEIVGIIRCLVTDFKPSINSKGLIIESNLDDATEILIKIDTDILKKIMINLLQNALKYSQKRIQINIEQNEDNVDISVFNDGELLTPEDKYHIFTMFGRKESNQPGCGIGLTFAKELALSHGWTLDVIFDLPNLNHFKLRIPVIEHQYEIENCGKNGVKDKSRLHILVVEDNVELKNYLAQLLNDKYYITTASNGKEALNILGQQSVSMVVSDIRMPQMDGVELCTAIKGNDALSHIPIILLTADNAINSKLNALACGADDYIEKPFSERYLIARIDNIIQTRVRLYEEFKRKPLSPLQSVTLTNPTEQLFIDKLTGLIENEIGNSELDVDFVATSLGMSRATLYRKAKGNLDMSIADFITLCRLKKGAKLLAENGYMISEVAYMVGFSTPSYFSRCFLKQFGITPKEFIDEKRKKQATE